MRCVALIILAWGLSGCAAGAIDNAGYLLPEQCRAPHELPHGAVETVTSREKITEIARKMGTVGRAQSANAITITFGNGPGFIFIADDLPPDQAEMTLRHERCHVLLGDWHN